jgi:hypothetical protein
VIAGFYNSNIFFSGGSAEGISELINAMEGEKSKEKNHVNVLIRKPTAQQQQNRNELIIEMEPVELGRDDKSTHLLEERTNRTAAAGKEMVQEEKPCSSKSTRGFIGSILGTERKQGHPTTFVRLSDESFSSALTFDSPVFDTSNREEEETDKDEGREQTTSFIGSNNKEEEGITIGMAEVEKEGKTMVSKPPKTRSKLEQELALVRRVIFTFFAFTIIILILVGSITPSFQSNGSKMGNAEKN